MAAAVSPAAQGMLAVIGNFKSRTPTCAKAMDERGQRAVAFALQISTALPSRNNFARHLTMPFLLSVSNFLSCHGGFALDVFAPEHCLQFRAADLASELVHLLVGDRAELALHVLGQLDAEFAFQQIGDAAFAGLAS